MLDRTPSPPADRDRALERLRAAARSEDRGGDLGPSVRAALAAGLASDEAPHALAADLVAVAEANLPAARLIEGHVNALQLVRRLGAAPDPGIVHGVWGADAARPVVERGGRLEGAKRYASGLGTVGRAVVTVGSGAQARLALVQTDDPARHSPEAWDMLGMRATASGEIDLTGLVPYWLGNPGDYFTEPHFLGGVWRIAALQLGGTLGLIGAARDVLDARGHLEADAQIARLGPLVGRAMAAFGLIERAAAASNGPEDPERAVMLSLQSRLLTEDLAQDAIGSAERSVGLAHFEADAPTGRRARDLATYCRQAARDAFEQRAGRIALGRPGPLSALWHG